LKYVIFDIDGTLTNTTEVDDKCYMNSFESLFSTNIRDVQWNQIKNVTDWGITEELISTRLNIESSDKETSQLKELFLHNLKEEYKSDKNQFNEITGATEFYKSLKANDEFKIGISTGGWEESANLKLQAIGINPYLVSFSNSNYFKSREEITLDVINQMMSKHTNPGEIIYFGDGEWDLTTCKKLNIRFIGIDSQNNCKLKNAGALEVYRNFENPGLILNSIREVI